MFRDRYDAAQQLLAQLKQYKDNKDVVVIAIPRGGLQIGSVLARELHAPLDVIFIKKLGAPGQEELAIGAVGLTEYTVDSRYDMPAYKNYVAQQIKDIQSLLYKRYQLYRRGKQPLSLENKIVIITDDGIATGQTMLLTLDVIKKSKPKKLIAAIPVVPKDVLPLLQEKADEVIALLTPEHFFGVGQFYQNFDQVEDEEAIQLLQGAQP